MLNFKVTSSTDIEMFEKLTILSKWTYLEVILACPESGVKI
jgi:hypothetical protein